MYTSIDVKAAEILLERKILRNLDLIGGETVFGSRCNYEFS